MTEITLKDLPIWADPDARKVLERLCKQFNVPPDVIEDLVLIQRERQYQERADGIYPAITETLDRME